MEVSKVRPCSGPLRPDISALRWLLRPERLQGWLPDLLDLFVNVPVTAVEEGKGGKLRLAAPACPRGGYAVLRAEVECVVVMSAYPMDLGLTGAYKDLGAEFEILNCWR